MMRMFEEAGKMERENIKTQALYIASYVWGNDPDKSSGKSSPATTNTLDPIFPVFQSPEAYANMSKEDKEKLTEQMMAKHRQWVGEEKTKSSGNLKRFGVG